MNKRLFLGITITLVLAVNRQVESTSNVCESHKCVQEAAKIIDYIDASADPCEDFYQFACGNFLKNAHGNEKLSLVHKSEDQSRHKLYEIYQEDIRENEHKMVKASKKLFKTCMDEWEIDRDFVKTINQTLKALGGWPVVEGSTWNKEAFDWLNTTYELRRLGYDYSAFLNLDVEIDPENKYKYILKVVPSLGHDTIDLDLNRIIKVAVLLGAENSESTIKELTDAYSTYKEINQVYLIANFFQLFNKYPGYTKQTVKYIQQSGGVIDWLELINNIVGPKVQITENDYILFLKGEYLKRLIDLISKTPKRAQANYMMWKFIEPTLRFLRNRLINPNICPGLPDGRKEFCVEEIHDKLTTLVPNPIEVIRHRRYLSAEKKKKIEELVLRIISEFTTAINKEQIPEGDKQQYINKIKKVVVVFGMSENYFEDKILDEAEVDMMNIKDNASFFTLLAQANKNHQTAVFSKLKVTSEHLNIRNYIVEWSTLFYDFTTNFLYVPLSATEDFVFDENRPNYLNYGELGTLIATQLSNIGVSLIHADTNITEDSQKSNQYSFLQESHASEMNSMTSIGQQVSYAAYKECIKNNGEDLKLVGIDYTPNQLFWITAANVLYEPNHKRIYVSESVQRNHNFIKDFNCPVIS